MLFLVLPLKEYLARLAEPRSIADIALVFVLVFAVLKLLRGTRAAPMAAAIGAFALLYWIAVNQQLVTLEFVLRGGLLYIGVAVISVMHLSVLETGFVCHSRAGITANSEKRFTMKLSWRLRVLLQPKPEH
jgi:hypothetical protein